MHGRSHQREVRSIFADAVVERLRTKVTAPALHVFDALLPGKSGRAGNRRQRSKSVCRHRPQALDDGCRWRVFVQRVEV